MECLGWCMCAVAGVGCFGISVGLISGYWGVCGVVAGGVGVYVWVVCGYGAGVVV